MCSFGVILIYFPSWTCSSWYLLLHYDYCAYLLCYFDQRKMTYITIVHMYHFIFKSCSMYLNSYKENSEKATPSIKIGTFWETHLMDSPAQWKDPEHLHFCVCSSFIQFTIVPFNLAANCAVLIKWMEHILAQSWQYLHKQHNFTQYRTHRVDHSVYGPNEET